MLKSNIKYQCSNTDVNSSKFAPSNFLGFSLVLQILPNLRNKKAIVALNFCNFTKNLKCMRISAMKITKCFSVQSWMKCCYLRLE